MTHEKVMAKCMLEGVPRLFVSNGSVFVLGWFFGKLYSRNKLQAIEINSSNYDVRVVGVSQTIISLG